MVLKQYENMRVQRAWAYSTGQGTWLGMVDTGVDAQGSSEFSPSNFSSGLSSPRYASYTRSGDPYTQVATDNCGHGTRIIGVDSALLMPEGFLRDYLHSRTIDMFDESAEKRLAQPYKVGVQALAIPPDGTGVDPGHVASTSTLADYIVTAGWRNERLISGSTSGHRDEPVIAFPGITS